MVFKQTNRTLPHHKEMTEANNMSFYKILKPVSYLSAIGGVYGIFAVNLKHPKQRHALISFYAVTVILNFLQLMFIPYGIMLIETESEDEFHVYHDENHKEFTSQHFILKIVNPVLVSALALCHRSIVLFQTHKNQSICWARFEQFDKILETSNHHPTKNATTIKNLTILILLASWPFQIYSYIKLTLTADSPLAQFIIFFLNIYNNFSADCCELQFISISWLISTRFRLVRVNLKKIGEVLKRSSKQEDIKRNIFSLTSRAEKDPLSAKISALKESHHVLCEACDELNRFYGWQLFFSLPALFVNVLLNLYFAIFGGFTQPATQQFVPQTAENIIKCVVWSLYYFGRFVLICFAAEILTKEGNSIKTTVCCVMTHTWERNWKEELGNFLNYANARKIKLTASGFCKIDLSLVTSAVAMGATYIVILAQFHKG